MRYDRRRRTTVLRKKSNYQWPRQLTGCIRCRARANTTDYLGKGVCWNCYVRIGDDAYAIMPKLKNIGGGRKAGTVVVTDVSTCVDMAGAGHVAAKLGATVEQVAKWRTGRVPKRMWPKVDALLVELTAARKESGRRSRRLRLFGELPDLPAVTRAEDAAWAMP